MTQNSAYGPAPGEPQSTAGAVREQASNVAGTAGEAGGRVAHTAAQQGREVAAETGRQARNLIGEASGQVRQQASAQQQRAASALRGIADELRTMSSNSTQSGVTGDLVHQASQRTHQLADWLEQRDPAAVLDEVRSYARRHPGMFLLGAAALGVVAGRLGRGLAAGGHFSGTPRTGTGVAGTGTGMAGTGPSTVHPGSDYSGAGTQYNGGTGVYPGTPATSGGTTYVSGAAGAAGTAGRPGEPSGYLAADLPVDEPVPGTGGRAGSAYRSDAGQP